MEEIRITLETLYDISRTEKKSEDLQKLSNTFFFDVRNYLKEKNQLLLSKKTDTDLFAAGEKEKIEYELRSIHRIIKEIYEKREKKIIDIAVNRSRTQSDIIDTSAMLKEEKDIYDQLTKLLDANREGILNSLLKGELPFFQMPKLDLPKPLPESGPDSLPLEPEKPLFKKIRFIHSVPSFVWKDLKEYGPFEEGEETEIFPEVADLIIEKGRAVEVQS